MLKKQDHLAILVYSCIFSLSFLPVYYFKLNALMWIPFSVFTHIMIEACMEFKSDPEHIRKRIYSGCLLTLLTTTGILWIYNIFMPLSMIVFIGAMVYSMLMLVIFLISIYPE